MTIENAGDPARNWMAHHVPGEVFPRVQLRIVRADGEFALQDETGWNGYEATPDHVLPERFASYAAAEAAMRTAIAEFE